MRSVVITGTSTGIGWGSAKVLIAHGFRVFGSVRKDVRCGTPCGGIRCELCAAYLSM